MHSKWVSRCRYWLSSKLCIHNVVKFFLKWNSSVELYKKYLIVAKIFKLQLKYSCLIQFSAHRKKFYYWLNSSLVYSGKWKRSTIFSYSTKQYKCEMKHRVFKYQKYVDIWSSIQSIQYQWNIIRIKYFFCSI